MSVFVKLNPQDIVYTKYVTYPSQTALDLQTQDGEVWETPTFLIDSDEVFSPGIERNMYNVDGGWVTGSYNLSGTVQVITNTAITNLEKTTIKRLQDIYGENSFSKPENYSSSSIFSSSLIANQYMTLVNIPSILYGEEIKPGSFKIEIIGGPEYDLKLLDDGYGGLLSSSVLIGSIFYKHGIVAIGHNSETFSGDWDNSKIHFSGTNTIPMMMYVCTAPRGMLNFSRNESFTVYNSSSLKNEITTKTNKTFITTVGLYDENYELLAVAKVGKPILNEENGSVQFRLKLNY